MSSSVQFIANTDDGLHCVQASWLMILNHFKPSTDIGWDEWSIITGFEAGKGTWPLASLLWFKEQGFNLKHVELFDFDKFAQSGADYLKQQFSPELFEWSVEHTNMPLEQKRARELAKYDICVNETPTIDGVKSFLDDGYLVRAHVNSCALNGRDGYFGHSVLVLGYDEESFILHDPGPPATPNRRVEYATFSKAFFTDGPDSGEIDAVKLSA